MITLEKMGELLKLMRSCNAQLAAIGDPGVTAAQMRATFPALEGIEAELPGLVDLLMRAGHETADGDEAAEVLIKIIESCDAGGPPQIN